MQFVLFGLIGLVCVFFLQSFLRVKFRTILMGLGLMGAVFFAAQMGLLR